MKIRNLIFLIILFIACTNAEIENSPDLATDSQRNWCYGIVNDISVKGLGGNFDLVDLRQQLQVAYQLYENETDSQIEVSMEKLLKQLEDKIPEGMRVCKIWADMMEIK